MQNAILQIKSIKKSFYMDQNPVQIFNRISYDFHQNKSYAIAGISGSGKSTLINILGGMDHPTQGSVYFNNFDINEFDNIQKKIFLNETIGIVFQEPYLIKELSVIENIILKAHVNKKYDINFAYQLLNEIGLSDKADQYPIELSVGQQQRIAILRALFNKPKFLLADEPTANLDDATKKDIVNLLLGYMVKWGMGLIITTHDQYIINLCHEKLQLTNGLLINLY